jgi:hypothetical protein
VGEWVRQKPIAKALERVKVSLRIILKSMRQARGGDPATSPLLFFPNLKFKGNSVELNESFTVQVGKIGRITIPKRTVRNPF